MKTSGPCHIDFTTGTLIPLVNSDRFPVGQVLTYGDMKNPRKRYVVTSADAAAYGQPVTCEDGHSSHCATTSIGRGGWRDTGETLTPEQLAEFLRASAITGERLQREANEDAEKSATARQARTAAALAKYSHLERVPAGGYSTAKLAAKNIRTELKAAFPGIKFSVTSDTFSGGDSVDIRWSMGPTTKEVEAITGKYQEGIFNGMEDIYENDHENVIPGLFGGAKYVSEQREDGTAFALIAGHLCDIFKIERPANNAFWNLRGDDDDKINGTTRGLMNCTSFPPGAIITGVEHLPQGEENREVGYGRTGFACFYRVTFTHPAAKITQTQEEIVRPEWDKTKEFLGLPADGSAITVTENTAKNGVEIRFDKKPASQILDTLKANGWRWSRFSACWYHTATAEARAMAARISGKPDTTPPADFIDIDSMYEDQCASACGLA